MTEELTTIGSMLPGLLAELVAAIVCGALIGLTVDRQRRDLGLRACVLFSIGVVLIVNIPEMLSLKSNQVSDLNLLLTAGIVLIVAGGLGVGLTLRGDQSSGLTGGAALWILAAVNLVIGLNQWLLGFLVTGMAILVWAGLGGIERGMKSAPRQLLLKLTTRQDSRELRDAVKTCLEKRSIKMVSFRADQGPAGVKLTIHADPEPEDLRSLITELWTIPGIKEIEH